MARSGSSDALGAATAPERYPEEELLEIYKLEWELIDIRRKQLRNTWQQLVLRDRAEEEERAFFREQARLLSEQARAQAAKSRADAVKYAEEHAEDILRRRGLTAVTGIGKAAQEEKENNHKARDPATSDGIKEKKKKKTKKKKAKELTSTDESSSEAPAHARAKPKPTSTEKTNGSGELPKKLRKEVTPTLALPDVPEGDSADDFSVDYGMGSPLPALDDGDELLDILSQEKNSDDSDTDHGPSMASLILPVSASSPARARPAKAAPRALTPTPQKRKRKPAAAHDEDFDFTRKGEQKRAAFAAQNEVEEEPESTPKKALKRRKELEQERLERLNAARSQDGSSERARSLMGEVASFGVAKIKHSVKPTSTNGRANGTTSFSKPMSSVDAGAASTEEDSADDGVLKSNKSTKPKSKHGSYSSDDASVNGAAARFSGVTMRSKKGVHDRDFARTATNDASNVRTTKPSSAATAKPSQHRRMPQHELHDDSNGSSSDDVGGGKPLARRSKKNAKDKRSKMDEVELALRKAEMLTRISQMQQEVATPKVIKKKKILKKSTASTLATKRVEFQQVPPTDPAGNGNVDNPSHTEQRPATGSRSDAAPSQPKDSTPPPEKLQFLQFTKGLAKSPMPFNLRSKLKSPVLASPMRKRPRPPAAPPRDQDEGAGMPSPAYSYGNDTSPRDSIADLTRAVTSASTSRQVAVGITTRPKKRKTATAPKVNQFGIPGGLIMSTSAGSGGASAAPSGGFSMFDVFVNTGDAPIPRLKTTSSGDMSPVV